jgi:hypothetical protein
MPSVFTVGQLVRVRKTAGRVCEVVRILPATEEGRLLYLIRSEQGAELIVLIRLAQASGSKGEDKVPTDGSMR